jgi:hypothetical protein
MLLMLLQQVEVQYMFNWKKWLLFVLLGFIAFILLLFAITYGIKIKFDLNSADTLAFAQ